MAPKLDIRHAIDIEAVAELMRRDRARTGLNQTDYGVQCLGGVSQRQISTLEHGEMRKLSPRLTAVLSNRFGRLPVLEAHRKPDLLVRGLTSYLERQLGKIALTVSETERRELIEHLTRQIRLLTEPHIRRPSGT